MTEKDPEILMTTVYSTICQNELNCGFRPFHIQNYKTKKGRHTFLCIHHSVLLAIGTTAQRKSFGVEKAI